ncbi:MAG: undecaprenyl-phosphate glucose phosphotransferase [Alteromonadales bacterium]|nr:undecaprenyl-phosphate glucose phosphotransferase [Alteromonadales bacterium]
MIDQGFIREKENQCSVISRIFDFIFIPGSLISLLYFQHTEISILYITLSLLFTSSYLLFAETIQLYRYWTKNKTVIQIIYTVISILIAIASVTLFLFFTKNSENVSRLLVGFWFLSALIGLTTWRISLKVLIYYFRRELLTSKKVAIIGLTSTGQAIAKELSDCPDEGYELISIYDDRAIDRLPEMYLNMLNGTVNHGIEIAKSGKYDVVYIALPPIAEQRIRKIIKMLGNTTVDIRILPSYFSYNFLGTQTSSIGNIDTLNLNDSPHRGGSLVAKRISDIVLSICILTIIFIPMMIISLLIKIDSKGPVLFKQHRYGLSGQPISVWKFRTMSVQENGKVVKQATVNDKRVTKLGKILRRTSLDELPQFFNVLSGGMSIVGPRPHAVAHNELYRNDIDFYMLRHKVRPGITGWAQVNGWRGETDTLFKMQKRVEYDLEYIKDWNLVFDMKIVFLTILHGFNDKNAV